MNSQNSLEMIITPFPDNSFVVVWWSWAEQEPGVFHPIESKTACPSRAKLLEVLTGLVNSPGLLTAPGAYVQWQAIQTEAPTGAEPTL